MSAPLLSVLFLCTGNSARSILAEAILGRLGADRFKAFSAGSQPKGAVNPHALRLLQSKGFDVSGFRSKSWNEFAIPGAPPLDFVFTVCDNTAGEACPIWPGQPISAHWGIPDPAAAEGAEEDIAQAFEISYQQMRERIALFVTLSAAELGLKARLDAIGRNPASLQDDT